MDHSFGESRYRWNQWPRAVIFGHARGRTCTYKKADAFAPLRNDRAQRRHVVVWIVNGNAH